MTEKGDKKMERDYSKLLMFQNTTLENSTTTAIKGENEYTELSISLLTHFPNHPFELYTGERFEDLKESIKLHGVISPLIVREAGDTYQILSGHNRCECARAVGFKTVPCIVLTDLSDDDALMIVLDSNTKQRGISEMKISEQAHIYALDVAVNKRQGKRTDMIKNIEKNLEILSNDAGFGTLSQCDTKLDTLQNIAGKYDISRATVSRLLRIDTLIVPLKERIDDDEFGVLAGVELSYLKDNEQEIVDDIMTEFDFTLDTKKAQQLRAVSKENKFNKVTAVDIFEGKYGKVKKVNRPAIKAVTLKPKFLSQYYTSDVPQEKITEEVETSIELLQEVKAIFPEMDADEIKNYILKEITKEEIE